MGEWIYESTFSKPRHLTEMNGQLHALVLPPGKEVLVPIGHEAGWDPEPVLTVLFIIFGVEAVNPIQDWNK
jgi:hypothetical protein